DRYFGDIQATIPEREGSSLFATLSQEHYNSNQVLAGMDEEAVYYQAEIMKTKQLEEVETTAYNKKLEEYHKAEVLQEQFQVVEDKGKNLQILSGQAPLFQEKEIKLENAERASKIASHETQVNEWRFDEKAKKQKLEEADRIYQESVKQLEKAQQ